MSIFGSITIEDTRVDFEVLTNNQVKYTVFDTWNHTQETKVVDGKSFMIALGIALNFDGEIPKNIPDAWSAAEAIQPDTKSLRFIP